jgi:uncharacterized protein YyaL (SSP411 family)
LEEWATELKIEPGELIDRWEAARKKLFSTRKNRIHPLMDDKILTDWNGLMIAALATGARILEKPEYADAARKAAESILKTLRDSTGRLLHRYRDGEAGIRANAGDYAFMVWGLIELYRATYEPECLERAMELQTQMIRDFGDGKTGGFFLTASGDNELPVRPVEATDGAIPSANSIAMHNLLRLFRFSGDPVWQGHATALSKAFAGIADRQPRAFTHYLSGIDFALSRGREVVISGNPDSQDTKEMLSALNSAFFPNLTVMLKTNESGDRLKAIAPYTAGAEMVQGRAAAYVCTGFSCHKPVTDVEKLLELIGMEN